MANGRAEDRAGREVAEVRRLQVLDLQRQQVVVPGGDVAGGVVGDTQRLDLRLRQAVGNVDGHRLHAQLLRRQQAGVADDDHALGVDDDRLPPAELLDGLCHGLHGVGVVAGVVLVRANRLDVTHVDLHGVPFVGSGCGLPMPPKPDLPALTGDVRRRNKQKDRRRPFPPR